MKLIQSVGLATLTVLVMSARAYAQVDTQSHVEIGACPVSIRLSDLSALDTLFATGQMTDARAAATIIVKAAVEEHTKPCKPFDYQNNYVIVSWVGSDAAEQMVLRRLLLRPPAGRPFASDLPGIAASDAAPQLLEVFVAGDLRATLVSVYRSTREENPLVSQAPAFLQGLLNPLFGVIAGIAGEISRDARSASALSADPPLFVTVSRVRLPFSRAAIAVTSVANVPKTVDAVRKDLDKLLVELLFDGKVDNKFARAYADQGAAALLKAIDQTPECTQPEAERQPGAPPPPESNAVKCAGAIVKALTDALDKCKTGCGPGTPGADDVKAMEAILDKLRDRAKTLGPTSVRVETSFANRPLTRLSFGAVAGVILKGELNKPRAKLSNDVLAPEPMSRLLTMAVLNISPWGYDSGSFNPTKREYVRFFVGGVLTPDFGLGGGVSVLIVRGVAVNVGGGLLFTKAVADASQFGQAPADATKPFELGKAKVFFIGGSYVFK